MLKAKPLKLHLLAWIINKKRLKRPRAVKDVTYTRLATSLLLNNATQHAKWERGLQFLYPPSESESAAAATSHSTTGLCAHLGVFKHFSCVCSPRDRAVSVPTCLLHHPLNGFLEISRNYVCVWIFDRWRWTYKYMTPVKSPDSSKCFTFDTRTNSFLLCWHLNVVTILMWRIQITYSTSSGVLYQDPVPNHLNSD